MDLVLFFAGCYAITWPCFFALANGVVSQRTPLGALVLYLGVFSPAIVALLITAIRDRRAGVRRLLSGIGRANVSPRYYVFAVSYIAVIKLAVALIHRLGFGAWPRFGTEPLMLIPFAILLSTPFQAGEEIGWRGFALPRLARRMGLGWASIVLGAIWAVWHLPQFFIPGADTRGQSFPLFVLQVTAISVAMAWLYVHTRMSLLLTMLLHASINNSKDIVPSATPGGTRVFGFAATPVAWLTVGLLWLCAIGFLLTMRGAKRTATTAPDGASPAPATIQREARTATSE